MSKGKVTRFFKKYFWEGQKLDDTQLEALKELSHDASLTQKLLVKYRRFVGLLIPALIVQSLWWMQAIRHDYFSLFPERYLMSITMIFGATVAGMTSEGGGAVAFPVMTLALAIAPGVARDFSLMIQATGMSCASFTIIWMKIKLENNSVVFCSIGAIAGMILGLEVIDELLTPAQKKLGFVCIWFSFAFSLFLLNREHKRKTYDQIQNLNAWKRSFLVFAGFLGGIFSAVAGSGVDICSFSVLTLLFRVSEKVATPTSILLMAFNSLVGCYWKTFMMGGLEEDAWGFLKVCAPVVVIFAPLGSFLSSHFHRQVLAFLVYILDTIALVG
ncbi:uncharacterized protein LOC111699913 [Eurytemora carolleeae]|uniref:uncharacterized protein LOC111699913 n=1 Tax=Eurytemora carolleeae TaxID=1294199 RepID=UPI000C784BC1|nr:uncharacterized protein LOC111699913 [Eurytemora carolleeae]|eukprot:XP_023326494.1 uncharacterized protein LOC111699913 [Eurytemora affinis]